MENWKVLCRLNAGSPNLYGKYLNYGKFQNCELVLWSIVQAADKYMQLDIRIKKKIETRTKMAWASIDLKCFIFSIQNLVRFIYRKKRIVPKLRHENLTSFQIIVFVLFFVSSNVCFLFSFSLIEMNFMKMK